MRHFSKLNQDEIQMLVRACSESLTDQSEILQIAGLSAGSFNVYTAVEQAIWEQWRKAGDTGNLQERIEQLESKIGSLEGSIGGLQGRRA